MSIESKLIGLDRKQSGLINDQSLNKIKYSQQKILPLVYKLFVLTYCRHVYFVVMRTSVPHKSIENKLFSLNLVHNNIKPIFSLLTYITACPVCKVSTMSCYTIRTLVYWMTSIGSFLGLWSTHCSTYSASVSLVPVVMHVVYTPLYLCMLAYVCLIVYFYQYLLYARWTPSSFSYLPPSHWLPSSLHMPQVSVHRYIRSSGLS